MILTIILECENDFTVQKIIEFIQADSKSKKGNVNRYVFYKNSNIFCIECNPFFIHKLLLTKETETDFKFDIKSEKIW